MNVYPRLPSSTLAPSSTSAAPGVDDEAPENRYDYTLPEKGISVRGQLNSTDMLCIGLNGNTF